MPTEARGSVPFEPAPRPHGRTVIEPPRGLQLRLREVWEYRELVWYLVLRSVRPRYRQTLLGLGWAVVPPFVMMVVFSVFLNRVAGVPSEPGIPYPLFSFSGLLIWQYFASAATRGSTSLLGNSAYVTKIYFPRVLIPLATVVDALFDLAVAFLVLIPLLAYYRVAPGWAIVLLPVWIVMALCSALAVSLLVTSLGIQYRDLTLAVPVVIQFALFATPVAYAITAFNNGWESVVLAANPMATVVQGFRWGLIGASAPPAGPALISAGVVVVTLVCGLLVFNRMERTFADEI